jgi:glucose-6-phosphate isomerase
MPLLTQTKLWPDIQKHAEGMARLHLTTLYGQNKARFAACHVRAEDFTLDFSRERVNQETLTLLLRLLEEQGFKDWRAKLFAGKPVNVSENRPALHMALRQGNEGALTAITPELTKDIAEELSRALELAEGVRDGRLKGATGKTIRYVIHVGIGGSDIGPRMLAHVFADEKAPHIHFIRNVDGATLRKTMQACVAEETIVLLASKSFTTAETLRNAETLKEWLAHTLGGAGAARHMYALTSGARAAFAFGVPQENILRLWDWVGGRFSVWSVMALPAMMAMGKKAFLEFLQGGRAADQHFLETPEEKNIPVLLALLSVWNLCALGHRARAVLPYAEALADWPAYVQQLEMESLGKSASRDGETIHYPTAPIVFGMSGTPAQHSFMQALHQGNEIIPAEILLITEAQRDLAEHQRMLLANGLAQAEALMRGKKAEVAKHFPGNRPSTLLVLKRLNPFTLGKLIGFYEHKVFTQAVLCALNPFDQWGVELGKSLADTFARQLAGQEAPDADTSGIMALLKET